MLYEPFNDPKREVKAQERMLGDSEKRSNEAYQTATQNKRNVESTGDETGAGKSFAKNAASSASQRPTFNTLRKREESWAEWTKPEALAKAKEQEAKANEPQGKSFSQSMNPRAAGWTASYSRQQEMVPLGQTIH